MSLSKLKASLTNWRGRLTVSTQEIYSLQQEIHQRDRAIAVKDEKMEVLQRQLAALRIREEESSRTEQSLREDLLKAAEGNKKLRQENVQLEASLNENRTALTILGNENEMLRGQKNRIQLELENMKEELTAIGQVLDSITGAESDEEMEVDQPSKNVSSRMRKPLPPASERPLAIEATGSATNTGESNAGNVLSRPINSNSKETAALGKPSKQPVATAQDMVVFKMPKENAPIPSTSSSTHPPKSNVGNVKAAPEVAVPCASTSSSQAVAAISVPTPGVASENTAHAEIILNSTPGFFRCICGVTLGSRQGLTQHIRYHTDKRYACPLCERQIHGHSAFKNHLIDDHEVPLDEVSVIGCDRCAIPFDTKAEFHLHRKKFHCRPSQKKYQGEQCGPLSIRAFMGIVGKAADSSEDDKRMALE